MQRFLPAAIFFGVLIAALAAVILQHFSPTAQIASNITAQTGSIAIGGSISGSVITSSIVPAPDRETANMAVALLIAQLVVTGLFMGASLFVVLSKRYPPADRHWAYGALGTILGFWLRAF